MSETSYVDESSLPAGLNKENPNVTFTTIDDKTVSSTTDGKPKILIFFRTTCENSQNTIQSIVEQNYQGVDIYAADIDKKSLFATVLLEQSIQTYFTTWKQQDWQTEIKSVIFFQFFVILTPTIHSNISRKDCRTPAKLKRI